MVRRRKKVHKMTKPRTENLGLDDRTESTVLPRSAKRQKKTEIKESKQQDDNTAANKTTTANLDSENLECGTSHKSKEDLAKSETSKKCELCLVKFEDHECFVRHMDIDHGIKVINDNRKKDIELQVIVPENPDISFENLAAEVLVENSATDSGIDSSTVSPTGFAVKKSATRQKRKEKQSPEHKVIDEADDFNVYRDNFECGSCRQVFESKLEMKNHFADHYIGDSYVCESCGEHIPNFSLFYDHCTQHIFALYCWDCKRCCKSPEELEQHKLRHKLSCDLCYTKFDEYQEYMKHMEAEHSIKGLKCVVCDKFFKSNVLLQMHMNSVHRGKPYKCEICNKGFTVRHSMLYHLERHSLMKPHACDICGDAFHNSTYLKYHKMKHSGDYTFKCPLCNKGYARKTSLKQHMNSHLINNTNLPFKCTLCGKGFDSKFKVGVHMKSHSDERSFKCDMCPRGFKFSSHLKRHKISHLRGTIDGKKKSCSKCLKSFFTQKELDNHTEHYHIPDSSRYFECTNCSMHFELLHEFSNHVIKHIKTLPLVCPMCEETFLLKGKLVSHIESHFPDHFPRPCTKCNVLIESESDVDAHVCAFPFNCEFCGEGFTSKRFMLLHVSTHTSEYTNFCQVCKKLFAKKINYKKHLRRFHSDSQTAERNQIAEFVPTKAKPYGCELCGVGFRYPSLLEKHLLKHVRDKEEEAIVKKIIGKPTHIQLLQPIRKC